MSVSTPSPSSGRITTLINFDGTGTPTIRHSKNVLSLVDVGVGMYRINFIINEPDIDYVVLGTAGRNNIDASRTITGLNPTVSSVDIAVFFSATPSLIDSDYNHIAIVR